MNLCEINYNIYFFLCNHVWHRMFYTFSWKLQEYDNICVLIIFIYIVIYDHQVFHTMNIGLDRIINIQNPVYPIKLFVSWFLLIWCDTQFWKGSSGAYLLFL